MSGQILLGPGLQVLDFSSEDPTLYDVAQSGRVQVRKVAAQRFRMTLTWPKLKRSEFRALWASIVAQRGRYETFTVVPPEAGKPEGVATNVDPYIKTTGAARGINILPYSEALDNWNVGAASVSADAASAPDGTVTADKIIEDTSTAIHAASIGAIGSDPVSTKYYFECYLKAAERDKVQLLLDGAGGYTGACIATFDLTAGAVHSTINSGSATNTSASIENVGSGWYRCAVSGNINSPGSTSVVGEIRLSDSAYAGTYTGDGTSGLFAWGGQIRSGDGPAIVSGANQTGLTLATEGWTPSTTGILKAGDLFTLSGHNKAYMLRSDADSDEFGRATFDLCFPLMQSPADAETITISDVPITCRLDSDTLKYTQNGALYDLSVDAVEAFA